MTSSVLDQAVDEIMKGMSKAAQRALYDELKAQGTLPPMDDPVSLDPDDIIGEITSSYFYGALFCTLEKYFGEDDFERIFFPQTY